jgi:hypothetical protein
MKGDPCFGKKNLTVRPVFKAVGSLLCWRLQAEWEDQTSFSGSLSETLLTTLPSAPMSGSSPSKSWSRWRSHSSDDSAFAGGSLKIAEEVLNRAFKLNLIERELANDAFNFFSLLRNLGLGTVSLDDDQLDAGLSKGYSVIFKLAGIEPGLASGTFLNLNSNTEFSLSNFQKTFRAKFADAESHAIDSAFAALTALGGLEEAINGAHNVLEGKKPDPGADLALIRDLLMSFYSYEAVGMVWRVHECMKLAHKPGHNTKALVRTAMRPLLARMAGEVKKL